MVKSVKEANDIALCRVKKKRHLNQHEIERKKYEKAAAASSGENRASFCEGAVMKIRLVNDDLELGTMLSHYLSTEGDEATLALSGRAGVSGRYQAMILDIMLPDIGSIEVLRQVQQRSRLPVIMLTAKGDNIDRVTGLVMGADDSCPSPAVLAAQRLANKNGTRGCRMILPSGFIF